MQNKSLKEPMVTEKYNTRTINLKSEQRELEGERQKDMDFHFSFFICCGNDPSQPARKGVEATLEPSHSRTDGPGDLAGNKLRIKSPCHSAKTELPLDLLPCYTHVGPWVSLRLSLVQVQSDSLAVHFSSNPIDHCQIRAILRGAVNLSRTAQGTFFLTLSVAQRHLFLQQIR